MLIIISRIIRKLFISSLSLFILIFVITISNSDLTNVVRTNLEIKDEVNYKNIYLLNSNNLLVKAKIPLNEDDCEKVINEILNYLIINNKTNINLLGTIPEGTKINHIIIGKDIVTLDFSKEILNISKELEKKMVESIVFSICDLGYSEVSLLVDGKKLTKYPKSREKIPDKLNKKIGINKVYNLTSRDNINRIVIYYLDNISNNYFYVPVTKYINDDREKIKIIIEELSSSSIYEDNLMSFLNKNIKLNSYSIKDNVMYLDFNEYIFDSNDKVLEEVIYTIAYSVFDNYDVDTVMFEVDNNNIYCIDINEIK